VRVFESIVTEFEDIVCFATEGLGAFRLFSDSAMAMSHPYSDEMGHGSLNEASAVNRLGSRPGPVHIAGREVIMASMPECFRPGIASDREVEMMEEHQRSD
jgi:hypothetical protein